MNVFQFFIICKRTNNANNATHYVNLGKKRRESSKRNYYIISPRVIIKAIIIIIKLFELEYFHRNVKVCNSDRKFERKAAQRGLLRSANLARCSRDVSIMAVVFLNKYCSTGGKRKLSFS